MTLKGFNDGLTAATNVINANQASQMRFPSGQSFGELINTEIANLTMWEVEGESPKR